MPVDPACASRPSPREISRERAVAIAQAQTSFSIESVEAEKVVSDGRPIWRVTLQGKATNIQPLVRETVIVEIDRVTGMIVSVGKS